MGKPDLATIPQFYHKYVQLVAEDDVLLALEQNRDTMLQFFRSLPPDKWDYRYAEGKWTVKEMLQHINDTERIFSYRALCFARAEKASLPGFDENDYAATSEAGKRSADDLVEEFNVVRTATISLFRSFSEAQLARTGIANNNPVTVNGIGFISVGHVMHHRNILQERYLP